MIATSSLGGDQDEKLVEQLIAENERMATQIDDIADECGCQEEVSNRHSHGRCIFNHLHSLQNSYDQTLAALAQKTRECEEKDATISDLRIKWNGALESEDAALRNCRELQAQVEHIQRQVAEMEARIETLIGTTCKRCERGDPLFVEPDTGFYTHTFGGNYCDAHRLHSVLNTKVGVEARARTK